MHRATLLLPGRRAGRGVPTENAARYLIFSILLIPSYLYTLNSKSVLCLTSALPSALFQQQPYDNGSALLERLEIPSMCTPYSTDISHTAPFFPNTAYTVLSRIFISSHRLHSRIYLVSRFTISSKSVMLLLPLTCHMPVMPGLIASLAR